MGKTNTPLGSFYRRIRSRIGGLGTVKATAHKLVCLVYRMLKYGEEYVTQSMEEYEAKIKVKMPKVLERKAAAMGYRLSPLPNPQVSAPRPSPSRGRPVTTHNAERPAPPASDRNARGQGKLSLFARPVR
jgi:hypothetical protein